MSVARTGGTTRRMVPACSWSPEDYYTASRRAHRAWAATQPQQVLPGVLEAADTGTASSGGVGSLERADPHAARSIPSPHKETT